MKGAPILTAVLFAAAAQPAAAAFPGSNGPIAFEGPGPAGAAIGIVNADGTGGNPQVVAVGPADRDPAWSPDGRRLAFTSTRDGNEEVYVLDLQTGAQTNVTANPARDHDPTWSPDGGRIAFASERDGNSEIYVLAVGGGLSRLTSDAADDRQPAWSSTGLIAFASDRTGDFDLHAMGEFGESVRRLTQEPGSDLDPSWAPDGSRLAFVHQRPDGNFDLQDVDAAGQNGRPLATNAHFPAWSPDGTRIAFGRGTGPFAQVLVMGFGIGPQRVGSGTDPNWGPLPPPVGTPDPGRTITVTATNARILVAPGTTQAPSTQPGLEAQVRSPVELPVGTTIDASQGSVGIDAVTTTPDGPGTVGHVTISGGVFTVTQGAAPNDEPAFTLVPGPRTCPPVRAARVPDPKALMRIRARGRFRSVTGYGRGSGRGTEWTMHDRCDGTTFKVNEGLVVVFDRRRRGNIEVPAGQCYLAAAERRRDALKPKRTCPRVRPPR